MELLEFGLLAFTSLFTVINPIGVLPVFLSMTQNLPPAEARKIALKASLTSFIGMVAFALGGQVIFDFFAISINGLKIVGGLLFFLMGYEMLQGKMSRTKKEYMDTESNDEFAITPLGIPMLCGPGTITVAVVFMQDNPQTDKRVILIAAMVAISLVTFSLLLGSRAISRVLGNSGNKVMTRVMGLIVMMIAVEFFFAGLKPIVHTMLTP